MKLTPSSAGWWVFISSEVKTLDQYVRINLLENIACNFLFVGWFFFLELFLRIMETIEIDYKQNVAHRLKLVWKKEKKILNSITTFE